MTVTDPSDSIRVPEGGSRAQHGQASVERGIDHEHAHGANVGSQQAGVNGVASGQHQGGRVEQSLQFA